MTYILYEYQEFMAPPPLFCTSPPSSYLPGNCKYDTEPLDEHVTENVTEQWTHDIDLPGV